MVERIARLMTPSPKPKRRTRQVAFSAGIDTAAGQRGVAPDTTLRAAPGTRRRWAGRIEGGAWN
jgi:hypothetical protein